MLLGFLKKYPDSPPVLVHPPVLFGCGFLVGLALNIWLGWTFNVGNMVKIGYGFIVGGFAICAWAVWKLRAAGTNVPTNLPTTALVTTGPYKSTRNPIYIGLSIAYLGLASLLDAPLALLSLAPVLFVLHVGVVLREEQYMTEKFGKAYEDYVDRSRRYF